MLRLSQWQQVFRPPFHVSVWVKIEHCEVDMMQDHAIFEFAKLFEMLDSLCMIGIRLHPHAVCPMRHLFSHLIPSIHIISSYNFLSKSVPVMSMHPIGLAQPRLNAISKCPLFLDNAQLNDAVFISSCLQAFFLSQMRTLSFMKTMYMKKPFFTSKCCLRIQLLHTLCR